MEPGHVERPDEAIGQVLAELAQARLQPLVIRRQERFQDFGVGHHSTQAANLLRIQDDIRKHIT